MSANVRWCGGLRPRLALLVGCALVGLAAASGADDRPPNVIVIFTDDHGYADMSCQGIVEDVRTPNIDRLAADGVRMTSGYVTAPQCVPSRAGLLTGRYQNRFGVESNGRPLLGFNDQLTIAERLRVAGYATGMIGKWHLGQPSRIVDHGFDDVFYQDGGWTNFDLDGNTVDAGTANRERYHLDAASAAAQAFVTRHHRQPFFLYVAYRAPHVPLDAPQSYLERFPGMMPERRRQALAMLAAVDDGVGGIQASLRRHGIEEHTLVFLIGDNGAPLKIHKLDEPGGGPGWDGSVNDPLNGEKGMLTEGGIRVPFLVSWKGRIAGGRVYDEPVISLDVAATALAAAGLPVDASLDGVDLLPFLNGTAEGAPHEALYWRWIAQAAVREGRWKYLVGGNRRYLFDLEADIQEQTNLLDQHPRIAERLDNRLTQWASQLDPPGRAAGTMSATWEQYFDHYLDGKPAPRPTPAEQHESETNSIQGWMVRNATLEATAGGVTINPRPDQRPFLTHSQLALPEPVTVTAHLRSPQGGTCGISWRTQGQKDFPADQTVSTNVVESDEWQKFSLESTGDGSLIHLRLLLPDESCTIERVILTGADGKSRQWSFAQGTDSKQRD